MTNNELINKGQQYVMNTYSRFPIVLVKGQGSYVWDANGKQYLDFVGGIAVCALGHCPDELNKVLQDQANSLWHVSNLYWNKPQVELAQKLVELSGLDKVFFCNSGAEANEAAIKLARKYFFRKNQANKNEIIVFRNSFHGRTMGALTATAQPKYHQGFTPLVPGFRWADYNNLSSVEQAITENTCAIMVEPIQGEGGIKPADPTFLRSLKRICEQKDLLLLFDEVQCGMGRTGKAFAYQHYGVTPHILTMAKALGGGFPLGAMLANEEVSGGFAPGDHASTFGGNPLATAVAGRVVDIIGREKFLQGVQEKGQMLKEALTRLSDPRIVAVRGKGLMLGIEFNQEVKELVGLCLKQGLLLVGAGPNVIRFVPPLTINDIEINQAVKIFQEALQEWDS
ncbi:acetylornithine/succinylornithine family transaminase [Syntrophomonas erecta]